MNAALNVNHSLWHQRTNVDRNPICGVCGNVVQFILTDMFDAGWVCHLGHKVVTPSWAEEPPCPFPWLHKTTSSV